MEIYGAAAAILHAFAAWRFNGICKEEWRGDLEHRLVKCDHSTQRTVTPAKDAIIFTHLFQRNLKINKSSIFSI